MSTPQPTYTISNLAHTTQYYVWIQAEDGIGNVSAPYQLPPSTTVTADGTPPQFSGSNVGLAGVGSDSIKVTWDAGFTDGTGVQSGLVYYSTADPGSNLAGWKASASNLSVAASNLGAAGEKTVGSLAAGTYYAYLSVADAAGNTLDVRPSPASVTLAAPVTDNDVWQFVITEKADGVGGANNFPGQIAIKQVRWNQTTTLTASMVTQMIPTNDGNASQLLNASVIQRWEDDVGNSFSTPYAVNDTLFTFTTPKVAGNPIWTIDYHRPIYRPGFKILRNGVSVYTESASVATDANDPSPYSWEYVTRKPTLDPASITSSDPTRTYDDIRLMFDKSYGWPGYATQSTPNTLTMTFAGPAKISSIRFYSLFGIGVVHSMFQKVELRGDPAGANVLMAGPITIRSSSSTDVGNWIFHRANPNLPNGYNNYYYDLVVPSAAAETYYQTVSVKIEGAGNSGAMSIIEMEIDGVIEVTIPFTNLSSPFVASTDGLYSNVAKIPAGTRTDSTITALYSSTPSLSNYTVFVPLRFSGWAARSSDSYILMPLGTGFTLRYDARVQSFTDFNMTWDASVYHVIGITYDAVSRELKAFIGGNGYYRTRIYTSITNTLSLASPFTVYTGYDAFIRPFTVVGQSFTDSQIQAKISTILT